MKALCIGHAAYDFTMPMDEYPKENFKYRVTNSVGCGGGPASNAAYLLSKWGINTYFAGVVGNDENGKLIEKEFKSIGVNTKYLEFDKKNPTTMSFIINNSENGSRTIFTKRSQTMKMTKKINEKVDLILVDGEDADAAIYALKKNPNAVSMIDAGRNRPDTVRLAKLVDYVVCSKDFVEDYTKLKIDIDNEKRLNDIFEILNKDFKNVIFTYEKDGAFYYDNGVKRVPSIDVTQVDSTGAGDIFHGAFAYCLLNKFDIEKTIKISNIAGAISVTRLGGRYSMPTLDEVMKEYKKCLMK